MENLTNKEFKNSLDITNDEIEKYIPELLQGLWELGSVPEYITRLIERNIKTKCPNVIDLGCGKGAVLVKIAKMIDIKAIGVDIVPEFIEEANKYVKDYGVTDKIIFKTEDIIETIKSTPKQDIVIYGYDSEILGYLDSTLRELTNCIMADGYIILEFMYANRPTEGILTENKMKDIIEQLGFRILDRIDWDIEKLILTNSQNTEIIKDNVNRLISQYPDKKKIFNEYLQNQIDECEELENNYICTTLLLRQKNYCA